MRLMPAWARPCAIYSTAVLLMLELLRCVIGPVGILATGAGFLYPPKMGASPRCGVAHLGRPIAERYMNMLEYARTVRAEVTPTQPREYSLTRYGLQRLVGGCAPRS